MSALSPLIQHSVILFALALTALATAGPAAPARPGTIGSVDPEADSGAGSAGRDIRAFRPSEHGFAFTNRFEGPPLRLGGWGTLLPAPDSHGLCGGMVLEAAARFRAREPMPDRRSPPTWRDALRSTLVERQLASFGRCGWQAMRFARWMARPTRGEGGTRAAIARELERIRARLNSGRPAPIGLVYRSFAESGSLWRNHQVLAYGVERDESGRVRIAIYDPNLPGRDDVRLMLEPRGVTHADPGGAGAARPQGYAAAQATPGAPDRSLHGIFLMPYPVDERRASEQ